MYPKPPGRQIYAERLQPYTPYPTRNVPPMVQKKKGFLAKLFKKHDPTHPFMRMVPPYRQMEVPPVMYQHYQPLMPYPEQMIPPQISEPNEMRGLAPIAPSGGISNFFTNLLSNPTDMLNNIEKVAQVAKSVGPVFEQYGPIVRSIPSIVKILTSGKGVAEEGEVIVTPPPSSKKKKIMLEPIIKSGSSKEGIPYTKPKPRLYV
ncbi:VrrA/YqfQ family protein [Bacillus sp. C1]